MFFVPDTSTKLTNLVEKRTTLTENILELGFQAMQENDEKIKLHVQAKNRLASESREIQVVLDNL